MISPTVDRSRSTDSRSWSRDIIAARLATEATSVARWTDVPVSASIATRRSSVQARRLEEHVARLPTSSPVAMSSAASSRPSSRRGGAQRSRPRYPFSWLGILPGRPAIDGLVYSARHQLGFALHSLRSPSISTPLPQSRPNGEDLADLSDDRISKELPARLAIDAAIGSCPIARWSNAHRPDARLRRRADAVRPALPGRRCRPSCQRPRAKGLNLAVGVVYVLAEGSRRGETGRGQARWRRLFRALPQTIWRVQDSWYIRLVCSTSCRRRWDSGRRPAARRTRLARQLTCRLAGNAENYVGRIQFA